MSDRSMQRLVPSLLLALAAVGCDGPLASTTDQDHADNGLISVDETKLLANMRGDSMDVSIPVHALHAGTGTLDVTLMSVDGEKELDRTRVGYAVHEGETRAVVARLALPSKVKQQSDRARYSVRVAEERDTLLQVTRSLMYVLSPYELRLDGPAKARSNKHASYRARVEHPLTHAPLPDTSVSLSLKRAGAEAMTLEATTDDTGCAVFDVAVEDAGDYEVSAVSSEHDADVTLTESLQVDTSGNKVLLTTDKPLYQPGQTLQVRALALQSPDNTPVKRSEVVFEIEDGKGNKVYKKSKQTSEYGIASVSFQLATIVNMGTYKVRALLGDVTSEKTVEVSHYALPKFEVKVAADRKWYGPGDKVTGTIDARYFFGKDVGGAKVVIQGVALDVGEDVFAQVMGMADASGRYAFSLPLPTTLAGIPIQDGNALVTLRVSVKDSAGQEVKKDVPITVAAQPIRLSLVPEATNLVPGIENRLHVFATDPLGEPVSDADVSATGALTEMNGRLDVYGHTELRFTPTDSDSAVTVTVKSDEGQSASADFSFAAQQGEEHVLVRTDKSIYELGQTVKIDVLVSANEHRVYVDWLNEGQAVDMRTLDAADGKASFSVPLDASLVGENRIEAYVVDVDGNIVRAGRTIVVNREGELHVALDTDKPTYTPGAPAKLTFSVTDAEGKPAPAALGVQIVDEAVFALIDARPGLLRTFFELEDAFAKPQYEIAAPNVSFEKLLFEDATSPDADERDAAQARAEASLAALKGNTMMGIQAGSWPATVSASLVVLAPFYEAEQKKLAASMAGDIANEIAALEQQQCTASMYYCSAQNENWQTLLVKAMAKHVTVYDFWGNRFKIEASTSGALFTLKGRGADEKSGTQDDESLEMTYDALGTDIWSKTVDFQNAQDAGVEFVPLCLGCGGGEAFNDGDGLAAAGGDQGPVPGEAEHSAADGTGNPRVRTEFPETLYVNPSLITDDQGKATVSLDMADSITRFRVSSLANAQNGKLGGGQGAVTIFQDFFVDVNFPAELTRGDEVDFPVVVYNYLKVPQTVALSVDAAKWFELRGSFTSSVKLGAGEVRSVFVPVRVLDAGTQQLTVHALADQASDAVARTVRVVPDGLEVPLAQSGSLGKGSATLSANFPSNAVPGSQALYLDVFPAFLSQAVQGLDSMLQVPDGCFEQTTSTTWPNVLVTRYINETGQGTPEIQLKAESLISAGYQRLLTFEHTGGGFSWFGEQDPAPFLSVTAFGLMEFSDMAKVQTVDEAMLERTKTWMLGQQKSDGSWPGDMTEFFSFNTSVVRNTAFTAWALAQNGVTDGSVQRALDYVSANLKTSDDSYTLALAANAFVLAAPGDAETGKLLTELDSRKTVKDDKASWDSGETQTNFYGSGNDAAVSTTALVVHAMINAGGYASTVNQGLAYLTGSKDPQGNFGSTQATVWALKTLLLAAQKGTEGAVGTLDVAVDGTPFTSIDLTKDQWDVMTRVDMSALAKTGTHDIELTFAGKGKVSYSLVSSHHVPWSAAPSTTGGPLSVAVTYDRTALAVNETVSATVTVDNLEAVSQNMVLVTLGIPPGFAVLDEDLADYVTKAQLSRFEKTGKQLTLYITKMEPNQTQTFTYRLRATMPVKAADGGAVAFPYYEPDKKAHGESNMLTVAAN